MRPRLGGPVEAYLGELTARLGAELGEELVGAWLFGSAALGDFDPSRSDLDVQAVSSGPLPRARRERLVHALSHDALPCPVRGLEFVLYAREGLADERGPAFTLNLDTGPRMARHVAYDPDEDPRFWFVLDVAIGRDRGRPLIGPPPADVFPALPRPLILASLREALAWYRQDDARGAQTVLAACRAWAWAEDGEWLSKGEAARWAAARLGDPDLAARLRPPDGVAAPAPLTPADVAAVMGHVDRALLG